MISPTVTNKIVVPTISDEIFKSEESAILGSSVDQATQVDRALVKSLLLIARILYEQLKILRKDKA